MDLTYSLSGLVQMLRTADFARDTAVRHLAYVLPLVKNPQNIALLLTEVSRAQVARSIEEAAFLVNGIAAAARHKREISNPTVPYDEFVECILFLAPSLDPICALCVLAGLLLGGVSPQLKSKLEKIIVQIARGIDFEAPGSYLAITPLAKAQFAFSDLAKARLPGQSLLKPTLRIVYHPSTLVETTPLQGPAFEDFGAYSHLIGNCLKTADLSNLLYYLDVVDGFCRTAAALYDPDSIQRYKVLIFGVSLQIQGICVQLLHRKSLPGPMLARRILTVVQPVSFVVEELGGKFDALSFFTNICFDVLLETGGTEPSILVENLGYRWWDVDPMDVRGRGRLLYLFEISEKLLPVLNPIVISQCLLPAAQHYLTPCGDGIMTRPVLEAAHSVMLAYLANSVGPLAKALSPDSSAFAIDQYLDKLLLLYPGVFTWTQFKTALDAILTSMAPPHPAEAELRHSVLEKLFIRAKSIAPGTLLPKVDDNGPPTLRAAMVAALLAAMPPLCDAREFAMWIDRIDAMIPQPYNDLVAAERNWLISNVKDCVVSLDLHLADVGIRYWFEKGSRL